MFRTNVRSHPWPGHSADAVVAVETAAAAVHTEADVLRLSSPRPGYECDNPTCKREARALREDNDRVTGSGALDQLQQRVHLGRCARVFPTM